jgi:ankyrin repeat protein
MVHAVGRIEPKKFRTRGAASSGNTKGRARHLTPERFTMMFDVRKRKPQVFLAVLLSLVPALLAGSNSAAGESTSLDLLQAADRGELKEVERLLKNGAHVSTIRPGEGSTALVLASTKGHRAVVRLLLKRGAKVNARNVNGWTALMGASTNGHLEIVKLLLEHKADVNAKHAYGWTALKLATEKGHKQIRELLLRYGASK